jgi:hypothetical protein
LETLAVSSVRKFGDDEQLNNKKANKHLGTILHASLLPSGQNTKRQGRVEKKKKKNKKVGQQ